MTSDEAVLAVIDAFDALRWPYMLVGSFASNAYGITRSTKDADFVIQIGEEPLSFLIARLGPSFILDPQMTFESVTMTTRHLIRVVGLPFTIELFRLSEDAHDQERFRRRRVVTVLGREVFLLTPEDVIVTKLRWSFLAGRPKDVEDARSVMAVQGAALDWDYIRHWCEQHGTVELLEEVRRSVPSV